MQVTKSITQTVSDNKENLDNSYNSRIILCRGLAGKTWWMLLVLCTSVLTHQVSVLFYGLKFHVITGPSPVPNTPGFCCIWRGFSLQLLKEKDVLLSDLITCWHMLLPTPITVTENWAWGYPTQTLWGLRNSLYNEERVWVGNTECLGGHDVYFWQCPLHIFSFQ